MTTMLSFFSDSDTCPDGWTSYTTGDGFSVIAATGGTGTTTSASGHTHTAATQSGSDNDNGWYPDDSPAATTSSVTYEPPYIQLKGCSRDHEDIEAPPSMILFTAAGACPSGWVELTAANGNFLHPSVTPSDNGTTVSQSTSHHHGTGSQGSGGNNCVCDTSTTDAGIGSRIELTVCEKL